MVLCRAHSSLAVKENLCFITAAWVVWWEAVMLLGLMWRWEQWAGSGGRRVFLTSIFHLLCLYLEMTPCLALATLPADWELVLQLPETPFVWQMTGCFLRHTDSTVRGSAGKQDSDTRRRRGSLRIQQCCFQTKVVNGTHNTHRFRLFPSAISLSPFTYVPLDTELICCLHLLLTKHPEWLNVLLPVSKALKSSKPPKYQSINQSENSAPQTQPRCSLTTLQAMQGGSTGAESCFHSCLSPLQCHCFSLGHRGQNSFAPSGWASTHNDFAYCRSRHEQRGRRTTIWVL